MICNDVIIGEDGWLFLHSGGQKQHQHLKGEIHPTQNSIYNFKKNILSRNSFCHDRNIPFMHIVFPTKDLVEIDNLPETNRVGLQSLYERHYAPAFEGDTPSCLYYPLNFLKFRNIEERMFYKLDTHLSSMGRIEITKLILRHFDLNVHVESYLNLTLKKIPGDLSKMLGDPMVSLEKIVFPAFRTARSYDNREYLTGNTGNIIISSNAAALYKKRLFICGDSFIALCLPYLSIFFEDVIYIRSESFQKDAAELFKPDLIISGNAERYLSLVRDDELSESVTLSTYGSSDYETSIEFADALRAQLSFKYHHNSYRKWRAREFKKPIPAPSALGYGSANAMLEPMSSGETGFRSTGCDPQIIFSNIEIDKRRDHLFKITFESNVTSHLVLHLSDTQGLKYPFSKINCFSAPVAVGLNEIEIKIPSGNYGPFLRVDPIACEGVITIFDISIGAL